MTNQKVIFLGTSDFSATVLSKMLGSNINVVGIVTQPDRPSGRNGSIVMSAVKQLALDKNIELFQFESMRTSGDLLKKLSPDIMVSASYGQILSQDNLSIAAKGVINVHASLLPRYRGSSPIQWAIANGEQYTGITIMQTALGVDSGDILLQRKIAIGTSDAREMFDRLAILGGECVVEYLTNTSKYPPQPQNSVLATHYPMLRKEDGIIDWNATAEQIASKVRAFVIWPSAQTFYDSSTIKVLATTVVNSDSTGNAGEIVLADKTNGIVVQCGQGRLRLNSIQVSGKRIMTDKEYIQGNKMLAGQFLSQKL